MMHRRARQSDLGASSDWGYFAVFLGQTLLLLCFSPASSQVYKWVKGNSLIGLMGQLARSDLYHTKSKLMSKGHGEIPN